MKTQGSEAPELFARLQNIIIKLKHKIQKGPLHYLEAF